MDAELHSRAVALLTKAEQWVQTEAARIAETEATRWARNQLRGLIDEINQSGGPIGISASLAGNTPPPTGFDVEETASGFTVQASVEIPDEWLGELVKIENAMSIGEGDGDFLDRVRRCVDAGSQPSARGEGGL